MNTFTALKLIIDLNTLAFLNLALNVIMIAGPIIGVLLGMYLVISGYLIYNLYKLTGIETLIRYIVMGVLALIAFVFVIRYFRLRHRPSLKKIIVTIFLLLIFGGLQFFVAYTLNKGLDVVDNISTQKYKTYKTSLIAMRGKLS